MMNTTPSMVYQELYDTSNRVLDDMSYHLANYIVSELGYRAIFFPRDCYYSIEVLVDNPNAAFSHVIAGYYAGIGTLGDSHNLIKVACTKHHVEIKNQHHWSCGICAAVCPVGEDLKLYRTVKPVTAEGILHCQSFGS